MRGVWRKQETERVAEGWGWLRLLIMFLCCKRVGINAHNFMAEHTLIRASEGKGEKRRRTEGTEECI